MTSLVSAMIRCRQLVPDEVDHVAKLLKIWLSDRSLEYWQNALAVLSRHNAPESFPKFGYVLETDGSLVGVLLTIFSRLPCGTLRANFSSWYVDPKFRPYGSLLSAQPLKYGVAYLNTTPVPHTLPILQTQGFWQLTSGVFLATGILDAARRSEIYTFPDCPLAHVPESERQLLFDHSSYGCICLWCENEDGGLPFIFRRRHIFARKLPAAHLIYCRDMRCLSQHAGSVSRFLLKSGIPCITVNCNGAIEGFLGRFFKNFRPMYCRGEVRVGDIAYTEGAMFGM